MIVIVPSIPIASCLVVSMVGSTTTSLPQQQLVGTHSAALVIQSRDRIHVCSRFGKHGSIRVGVARRPS